MSGLTTVRVNTGAMQKTARGGVGYNLRALTSATTGFSARSLTLGNTAYPGMEASGFSLENTSLTHLKLGSSASLARLGQGQAVRFGFNPTLLDSLRLASSGASTPASAGSAGTPPAAPAGGSGSGNGKDPIRGTATMGALMKQSGVKFGTSGARGLATAMTDKVIYGYAQGYVKFLREVDGLEPGAEIAIAGDLRTSTDRIMRATGAALSNMGYDVTYLGKVPTPVAAYYGVTSGAPVVVVTGSHIPADRNGVKYYLSSGKEVLKHHEGTMMSQSVEFPEGYFDAKGAFTSAVTWQMPAPIDAAVEAFKDYILGYICDYFDDETPLVGMQIALYEHSSVAREILYDLLVELGAQVDRIKKSRTFIAVDTEDYDQKTRQLARILAAKGKYDAIVTTDGDGDRPGIADAEGTWLGGDVLGALVAEILGASVYVTTESCSTAAEVLGLDVKRVRIGSPYVVELMQELAEASGDETVVLAAERNGGFFTGELMTRDAMLPLLVLLAEANLKEQSIEQLAAGLPSTSSGGIVLPKAQSLGMIRSILDITDPAARQATVEEYFGAHLGNLGDVSEIHELDAGNAVKIFFGEGDDRVAIMLRPSGNEPKCRIYTEAVDKDRRDELLGIADIVVREVAPRFAQSE